MSGGQDDASNDIESSGIVDKHRGVSWSRDSEAELRRLLEACRGNSVLESQLKERIEDAEDARDAKAAIEEGGYVPYEEFRKTLKKENDVEELDLSKPCEVRIDGEWKPVISGPVYDRSKHKPMYGCYFIGSDGQSLSHWWVHGKDVRNIRSPQYEPHTMETLLPLAGDMIHVLSVNHVCAITCLFKTGVNIGTGTQVTYEWLKDQLWATGPNKGKPVARKVA